MHGQQRDLATYWTADVGLFAGTFRYIHGEPRIVRARVPTGAEAYRLDAIDREIVSVAAPVGTRTYVHLQPSRIMPDIRLTVALRPGRQPDGAIGEVVDGEERDGRRPPIGTMQAWYTQWTGRPYLGGVPRVVRARYAAREGREHAPVVAQGGGLSHHAFPGGDPHRHPLRYPAFATRSSSSEDRCSPVLLSLSIAISAFATQIGFRRRMRGVQAHTVRRAFDVFALFGIPFLPAVL